MKTLNRTFVLMAAAVVLGLATTSCTKDDLEHGTQLEATTVVDPDEIKDKDI